MQLVHNTLWPMSKDMDAWDMSLGLLWSNCMCLYSDCRKILGFLPLPSRWATTGCSLAFFRMSLTVDMATEHQGAWRWLWSLSQNSQSPSGWKCTLWCQCEGLQRGGCDNDDHVSTLTSVHVSDRSPWNVPPALNYFLDIEKNVWTAVLAISNVAWYMLMSYADGGCFRVEFNLKWIIQTVQHNFKYTSSQFWMFIKMLEHSKYTELTGALCRLQPIF